MAKRSVEDFRSPDVDIDKQYFTDADIELIVSAVRLPLDGNVDVTVFLESGELGQQRLPKRDALTKKLNDQARWYFGLDSPNESHPTPTQLHKAFEGITKAADKLLDCLFPDDRPGEFSEDAMGSLPDAIRGEILRNEVAEDARSYGCFAGTNVRKKFPQGLLDDTVEAIYRLRSWSAAAQARACELSKIEDHRGHSGDGALNALFEGLMYKVWVPVFEQQVSAPYNDYADDGDEANSPLTRFIYAVLQQLKIEDKDGKVPSYDAIRSRVRSVQQRSLSYSPEIGQ